MKGAWVISEQLSAYLWETEDSQTAVTQVKGAAGRSSTGSFLDFNAALIFEPQGRI